MRQCPTKDAVNQSAIRHAPIHEIWLSAISVREIPVLNRKRRLALKDVDVPAWVADALAKSPVQEAPITYEIAMASEELALSHWDPADRFITATAQVLGATLITADARLTPGLTSWCWPIGRIHLSKRRKS